MRSLAVGVALLAAVAFAPPPNRVQQEAEHAQQQQTPPPKHAYEFTYSKYLEEVVRVLEEDPKFNEKLRSMPEQDIKDGKIADHVEELPDPLMERLHQLKLAELERLREQIAKQVEADGGPHNVKLPEHLDLQNWEKFNKDDLRALIKRTVADMEEIDAQRRGEFKDYEMKKKAEEDHKLAQMNSADREAEKHKIEEEHKRHNEHEKLKHPGGREQLEEVWEEGDNMDKDSYDPKTFFALHDLNGDGFWNSEELDAIFQIELEKMYNETNPDDDIKEKIEETYRMREHVVKQMDKNEDRMISLQEFMQDTEAQTPNKDQGWDDIGQQLEHNQIYTEEELRKFEEEYAKQQGWGSNAYEPVDAPPPAGQQPPIQPAAVNRAGVPDPNLQHPAQPPAPPVHNAPGGQQQQVHAAQPPQHQQPNPAQAAPQAHQPIHDVAKDPTYGI